MRLLALETSTRSGSAAILENGELQGRITLPAEQGSGRSLAPGLERLLQKVGWSSFQELDCVAVSQWRLHCPCPTMNTSRQFSQLPMLSCSFRSLCKV